MKVLSLTIGFRKTIKILSLEYVTNFAANHKTLHFKSEILTSTIFFLHIIHNFHIWVIWTIKIAIINHHGNIHTLVLNVYQP